jgi:methionyl-tRNA synthetase
VWALIGKANKYIDTMKPWALATQDRERLSTVLNTITGVIKIVSVLLWPFMPHTAEKIQHQLGLGMVGEQLPLNSLEKWGETQKVGHISKAPPLFPRVKPKMEEKMKEEPGLVSLEDFQRLDMRVGTIKEAETIPGSKKLLKLVVDIGEERTIVAGMAAYYQTNELINKQVIVIANLVPVTLMGIESRGMILAVEDEKGVYLLIPDKESNPGSNIK